MSTTTVLLVILFVTISKQDIADNTIDDPLEQAKNDILNEQTFQNVGGILNNFMQSEGAKQLGNILSSAATGENAGEILQGLGSVLGQGNNFNPSVLGMMMNLMQPDDQKNDDSFDMNSMLSMLGGLMGQPGENVNIWSYAPMILQTANAFLGPEAEERAKNHLGHAQLMPPIIEKLHLLFDHFINSELGKNLFNTLGAEKFFKIFADENGRMSYRRFVDMLENHSFRKHWIRMVTSKIATMISHLSDPKTQKKYLTTIQHFVNSILKSQRYPKTTLFDYHRPTESLSALVNHIAKESLKMQIDAKHYVKPLVEYVKELFLMAEQKGMLAVDTQQLSDKLADTINLEGIEPLVRVNRAYRFARKVHSCDKYVMCLVNHEPIEEKPSLPGLRPLLSKSSSLIFSWFLSSQTKTPYWDLYRAITEGKHCQKWYVDACNDFHVEEMKVKREVVHNEL